MKFNLEGLIPLLGGIYALLAAKGVVMVSKNPDSNQMWVQKHGKTMKVLGPILIVFGIITILGFFR